MGTFLSRSGQGAPAPPLDLATPPDLLWQVSLPADFSIRENPIYLGGSLLLNLRKDGTAYSYASQFLWLDCRTQQYSPDPATPFTLGGQGNNHFAFASVLLNGVLYIAYEGGGLYALDPNTRQTLWSNMNYNLAANVCLLDGKLVFPTVDGKIVALDLQGNYLWSYSTGQSEPRSSVTSVGGVMICAYNNTLYAFNGNGVLLWNYRAPANVLSSLTADNQNVYFLIYSSLLAINGTTGTLSWNQPLATPYSTEPVVYGDTVCVVTTDGNFQAFKTSDGSKSWNVPLGAIATLPGLRIFIEDGIAYVGCRATNLSAIDLASQGKQLVRYALASPGYVLAVENGVCYFLTGAQNSIGAVDLAHQIHEYFCESQLMADDYGSSTAVAAGYQPNSSWYRTQIKLLDVNSVPRANKSIQVSVSDEATIVAAGQTYHVTPASPLWLTTSGGGELSLAVEATDLGCPALSLWGNFMDPQESILVYPDHDTANTLSQVDAGSLTNAKTYDGTTMLPSNYTGADQLARSIQQAMGAPAASRQLAQPQRKGHQRRRRRPVDAAPKGGATTYIAFPDASPNMLYQSVSGPTERSWNPGSLTNWSLSVDPATGAATFSDTGVSMPALPGSVITDIKTFTRNAVHGAEKLAGVVWTTLGRVAQAIITTAENTYKLVVSAVEHAIAVVGGILKSVINDIKKAVQWLSYIFNWDDILRAKDNIKGVVNNWLTSLESWTGDYLGKVKQTVNSALEAAQRDVAGDTSRVVNALGPATALSSEVHRNSELAFVGTAEAKWYSAMHWITSKFTDNLPRHSLSKITPASYQIAGGIYDNVFLALKTQLAGNAAFQQIRPDLDRVLKDLTNFASSPAAAATGELRTIVQLIGDVVQVFFEVVELAADDVLSAVPQMITAIRDLLNQEVSIFAISDLWKAISRDPLTLVDLAALLIAVPGTIITKVKNSVSTTALPGASTVMGETWYWFAAAIVNNNLVGLVDYFGQLSVAPLSFTQLALQMTLTAFLAPATGQEFAHPTQYVGWIGSVVAVVVQMIGVIKKSMSPDPLANSATVLGLTSVLGVSLTGLATANYFTGDLSDSDRLKSYLVSLFGDIPTIMKPLKLDEMMNQTTLVLSGIDLFLGDTRIGIRTSLWA